MRDLTHRRPRGRLIGGEGQDGDRHVLNPLEEMPHTNKIRNLPSRSTRCCLQVRGLPLCHEAPALRQL
eukprot:12260161-Prorocentrum_lima.AAC.1